MSLTAAFGCRRLLMCVAALLSAALALLPAVARAQAGLRVWTNRYSGPGNDEDFARAVAVDATGSVLVAGSSNGGTSDDDFVTIKYSDAGVPLWANRYSGPGNNDDSASAVAVDANLAVTVRRFVATR